MKKYLNMFLYHTYDCLKGYVIGLVPRTRIIPITNAQGRRMICISKDWMGKTLKSKNFELNELNPEFLEFQKKNIPRIQKNIEEYEETLKRTTADKTD